MPGESYTTQLVLDLPPVARGSFSSISLSGIRGSVRVITGNGNVTLAGTGGEAYVKSSYGLVRAERIGGACQLRLSSSSSSIEIRKSGK